MICQYFFNRGFKFWDYVCDGCHGLKILCLNMGRVSFITIKDVDYFFIIHSISKSEAINLLKDSVLKDRGYI